MHGADLREHPEELLDLAAGPAASRLTAEQRDALAAHVAVCGACAAHVGLAPAWRELVAPGSSDEGLDRAAVERALVHLHHGEQPAGWMRRLMRPGWALALAGTAAAVLVVNWARGSQPGDPSTPDPTGVAPQARPETVHLADGSEISPVGAGTAIEVAERTPARTVVRLASGSARFRVPHDGRRIFRVEAGAIHVEDLGTVFRVDRLAGDRVRVVVTEGRVAIFDRSGRARGELGAGSDRVFAPESLAQQDHRAEAPPPAVGADATALPEASVDAPAVSVVANHRGPGRVTARAGEKAGDLLLAADTARQQGRPEAAVHPLRQFLERHPSDPRAAAAAFTLGLVLLTDLDRPREATAAFARAGRMARNGALREDAAARLAEAWKRAGDGRRAEDAARRYQATYPHGRYNALLRGIVFGH